MSCQFHSNFTIGPNITYSQFTASFSDKTVCPSTHLRADPGGAFMPWLYVLFLLLFHLPACIIRAVRWESAQYLALGLALFNIAVTIQSYISTKLDPAEVLVWMPLTLMLDIGAMLQMVILILEMEGHSVSVLAKALGAQIGQIRNVIADGLHRKDKEEGNSKEKDEGTGLMGTQLENLASAKQVPLNETRDLGRPRPLGKRTASDVTVRHTKAKHALVALCATVLGIMPFVLQMYGLAAAKNGMHQENLTVSYCSPAFRDFAVAVTTGNCERYSIIESASDGIGCIELPVYQQEDWLKGTFATLIISLVFEVIDLLLVKFAKRTQEGVDREVRGTRLRRPWLSMFGGALILIILIYYGVLAANGLPRGVTNVVWIYRMDPNEVVGRVCQAHLRSPGLRGVIIGWNDGLFDSWGSVYHGSAINTTSELGF